MTIDSEEFYNVCQNYRHSMDNGNASKAFDACDKEVDSMICDCYLAFQEGIKFSQLLLANQATEISSPVDVDSKPVAWRRVNSHHDGHEYRDSNFNTDGWTALYLHPPKDSVKRDAERYQWLRSLDWDMLGSAGLPCVCIPTTASTGKFASGDDLDEVIDKAMIEASK